MLRSVKKLGTLGCVLALSVTFSTAAMAMDASKANSPAYTADNQMAQEVAHRIRMYPRYDIFDWVEGTVENGVVTLRGEV